MRPGGTAPGAGPGWSLAPRQFPASHWPACLSVSRAPAVSSFSATSAGVGRAPGRASRSWRPLPGARGRPGRAAPRPSISGCSAAASLLAAPPGPGQASGEREDVFPVKSRCRSLCFDVSSHAPEGERQAAHVEPKNKQGDGVYVTRTTDARSSRTFTS